GPALAAVGRTAEGVTTSAEGFREHAALAEPLALAHPGTHLVNQAYALVEAGRLAEADDLATVGYEVAGTDNVPIAQIWFALVLGKAAMLRGQAQESRRWYQEGASTARLHGFRGPLRIALSGQASADAVLAQGPAASEAMAESGLLPPYPFLGHDQAVGPAWTAWAEGDPARARAGLVAEAEAATTSHNVASAVWLWHDAARLGATHVGPALRAVAARSDSPLHAARAAHVTALEAGDADGLTAATDLLEGLGTLLFAAEAASAASDAHRRAGRQRLATNLAHRSAQLAAQCPDVHTPALVRTEGSVALTAREREVASLAAQGTSSQDIADRLFVSIRTVNNHLQNAYTKLGVNRRDQLAAALGSR
ncbi:MAG TPA: helix-turn-helix transcriptional regulator, partial [Iamia sp.]|nr:helix-turn-helix transcriptional regulator [Iamia sp.]